MNRVITTFFNNPEHVELLYIKLNNNFRISTDQLKQLFLSPYYDNLCSYSVINTRRIKDNILKTSKERNYWICIVWEESYPCSGLTIYEELNSEFYNKFIKDISVDDSYEYINSNWIHKHISDSFPESDLKFIINLIRGNKNYWVEYE